MNNGQQTAPSAADLANQHQQLMSLDNRDRIAVCSDTARILDQSVDTRAAGSSSSVADNAFITPAANTPSFDPRLSIHQHNANAASSNNTAVAMNQTQSITYASNDASSAGTNSTANMANQANLVPYHNNNTSSAIGIGTTIMPQTHPAFVGYGSGSAPVPPPPAPQPPAPQSPASQPPAPQPPAPQPPAPQPPAPQPPALPPLAPLNGQPAQPPRPPRDPQPRDPE